MGNIKIDQRLLKGVIAKTFDQTIEIISEAMDDAITDERYQWPRETKRKNGQMAGSPRSIIDTGKLLESKVVARSSSKNAAEFRWETEYAVHVHQGATLRSGTELPARPWTEVGLEIAEPKKVFKRALKKQL